jgi:hypothetical protein
MRLNPNGREVYSVEPTLSPTATGTWEASFDGGSTWINGTDLSNGSWGWLLAGPDATVGSAVYTVPAGVTTITPLLRLTTGQEEIVDYGPVIEVS